MAVNDRVRITGASFPPGSNRVFVDAFLRTSEQAGQAIEDSHDAIDKAARAESVANEAKTTADAAKAISEEQRIRNDAQDLLILDHGMRLSTVEGKVADHETRIVTLEGNDTYLLSEVAALETWRTYITRQRSEVVYSGIALNIPITDTNLFTLLNPLTPTSGTLAPFFLPASGRMKALNKNLDLKFKVTIIGTFAGSPATRSLKFTLGTSVPEVIFVSRNVAQTQDNMSLSTFFPVVENDEITNPGITCLVQAIGGVFTATQIKISASQ